MTTVSTTQENCAGCPGQQLIQLGLKVAAFDYVIGLAGNPNTGKSTVFNALTGLRQHTGNWPGKTVARAEGSFGFGGKRYKLVDLPGTYSLLSTSEDEEIARNFILFGQPDVTIVVVDATRLERNLNLALQVLEITNQAVVCLNLVDEARRHGIEVDHRKLSRELGVPVVPTAARQNKGINLLVEAVAEVATGSIKPQPRHLTMVNPAYEQAIARLSDSLSARFPGLPNTRWVALRLLDGDERIAEAVRTGELGQLATPGSGRRPPALATAGVAS